MRGGNALKLEWSLDEARICNGNNVNIRRNTWDVEIWLPKIA